MHSTLVILMDVFCFFFFEKGYIHPPRLHLPQPQPRTFRRGKVSFRASNLRKKNKPNTFSKFPRVENNWNFIQVPEVRNFVNKFGVFNLFLYVFVVKFNFNLASFKTTYDYYKFMHRKDGKKYNFVFLCTQCSVARTS